jgi:hypothetical protein
MTTPEYPFEKPATNAAAPKTKRKFPKLSLKRLKEIVDLASLILLFYGCGVVTGVFGNPFFKSFWFLSRADAFTVGYCCIVFFIAVAIVRGTSRGSKK